MEVLNALQFHNVDFREEKRQFSYVAPGDGRVPVNVDVKSLQL